MSDATTVDGHLAVRAGQTPRRSVLGATIFFAVVVTAACGGGNTPPHSGGTVPGADRAAKTAALEAGANLMQAKAPGDLAQCVLFDGDTAEARLMGIEYIISEKPYNTLPTGEKAYRHPHNYEILSGQLRMPGLPDVAETEALEGKMNSYGKTWHTWMTGMHRKEADPLPFGPPRLQWSFNRDGEAMPDLVAAREWALRLRYC